MSVKSALKSFIIAFSRLPFIRPIVHAPAVQSMLQTFPGFRVLYRTPFDHTHPFDRLNGTDTSGVVTSKDLPASEYTSQTTHFYWGAQPSVVRSALAALPSLEKFTFIDLGCGKGRPLFVASEFPFREIIGVELSPPLVEIARTNAAHMKKRYPGRPQVRIEVGDAGAYRFPPGNIVLFLYNPFGEEIMSRVLARLEEALAVDPRTIYVVYQNPVWGACLDGSSTFRRYFAANIPYAPEERGFGPDITDAVVIWQSGDLPLSNSGGNAPIIITRPGHRADIAA